MDYRRGTDGQAAAVDVKAKKDHGTVGNLEGLRSSDIEPYTGLRYLSKLFRFMAVKTNFNDPSRFNNSVQTSIVPIGIGAIWA